MAGSIKGIIVEIGGDTSGLQKALSKVNSATSSLSKELRGINSLLKLDPSNTTLLAQKQEVLAENIENTREKLKKLKKAQEEADKIIASGGEISQENYRNLQREIIATENKLKELQIQASKWTVTSEKLKKVSDNFNKIGTTLTNVGKKITTTVTVPIIAVGTLATKSAIEFQSAFTGVEKTVNGTTEQMANLKKGIRDMAKEIPVSTTEISAVAEVAGQLGIATDDILSFTRVMIDLGNSTNLSAEEAASSLAKFANITKMSAKDYDKLGSTIVALGNNFATTEADIVNMATNLASTGELAGLSQPQILALATAMSSVGIEAEAGGSAMSKLLKKIQVATETGGKDLNKFASVAGMTSSEFKRAFEKDAVSALSSFISGLNDTERNGKSAISVLDDMGLTEVRLSNTILSLANASDVMQNAVEMGNKAWNENTALTNEASKRYETLESKMKIVKQKFQDIGITIGNIIMPYIEKFANKLSELTDKFSNLSPKTQEFIVKAGAIIALLGPAILIIGKVFTALSGITGGLSKLCSYIAKTKVGLTGLSKVISMLTGPVGIIIGVITVIIALLVVLYKKSETFRNAVNKGFETIKIALLNMWNTIKPPLQELGKTLSDLLIKLKPVGEFLVKVLGVAFTIIANVLSVIINILAKVIVKIVEFVTSIIKFFTETIPNAFTTTKDKVSEFVNNVITFFQNLPYNIGLFIGQMIGHIIQFGIDTWNWVTTELPKIIQSIIEWFKQLPSKIWTLLVNTITKIGEWIANMKDMVVKKVPEIVNSIIDFFKNLPQNMLNIGKNIVEGLWNGIKNSANWIKEKVGEFAKGILDGMKQSLGIHSPSRLFRDEVGKYIALGVGEGFNKNIDSVYNAMKSKLNLENAKLNNNLVSNLSIASEIGSTNTKNQAISPIVVNFYPQQMTEGEMDRAFNYINKKWGMCW